MDDVQKEFRRASENAKREVFWKEIEKTNRNRSGFIANFRVWSHFWNEFAAIVCSLSFDLGRSVLWCLFLHIWNGLDLDCDSQRTWRSGCMWVGVHRLQDQIRKSIRHNSRHEKEATRFRQAEFHYGHRSSSTCGHAKQEFRRPAHNRIHLQLDENRDANRLQSNPREVLHGSNHVVHL